MFRPPNRSAQRPKLRRKIEPARMATARSHSNRSWTAALVCSGDRPAGGLAEHEGGVLLQLQPEDAELEPDGEQESERDGGQPQHALPGAGRVGHSKAPLGPVGPMGPMGRMRPIGPISPGCDCATDNPIASARRRHLHHLHRAELQLRLLLDRAERRHGQVVHRVPLAEQVAPVERDEHRPRPHPHLPPGRQDDPPPPRAQLHRVAVGDPEPVGVLERQLDVRGRVAGHELGRLGRARQGVPVGVDAAGRQHKREVVVRRLERVAVGRGRKTALPSGVGNVWSRYRRLVP